jgi:hypothetical protein
MKFACVSWHCFQCFGLNNLVVVRRSKEDVCVLAYELELHHNVLI